MDSLTNVHSSGLGPRGGHQGFYALVSYVPDPLGEYLNRLRSRLVTGCRLQSHVTLLPPRMLRAPSAELIEELNRRTKKLPPFEVTLGEVEIFETTRVIYLAIQRGWRQLEDYHSALSEGMLWYEEYFPFHPHMNLGQEIPGSEFEHTFETAREVWRNCPHSRTFRVQNLTFVQNVDPNRWDTLSEHRLSSKTVPANLLETK